ncbi:MAG: helix-turn-helix transcriptional regulator [Faecalibacillus sp.]
MKGIETNNWIVLNAIIYDIYTIKDLDKMRYHFLDKIKMILDFDAADFYLSKRHHNGLDQGIFYNCDDTHAKELESLDYSKGIAHSGKSMVYRETDIIDDHQRVETEYYQHIYKKNHWHYALQMVLAYEGQFVGVVTFYRNIGKQDFTYEEIFLVDMFKEHMAYRIYQSQEKTQDNHCYSIDEIVEKYDLTKQEKRILDYTMQRKTKQEICDELFISMNTLKKHTLNIYRKLHINSRLELFKMIKGNQ